MASRSSRGRGTRVGTFDARLGAKRPCSDARPVRDFLSLLSGELPEKGESLSDGLQLGHRQASALYGRSENFRDAQVCEGGLVRPAGHTTSVVVVVVVLAGLHHLLGSHNFRHGSPQDHEPFSVFVEGGDFLGKAAVVLELRLVTGIAGQAGHIPEGLGPALALTLWQCYIGGVS